MNAINQNPSVPNFLEEEDYSQDQPAVPNFFEEEDYSTTVAPPTEVWKELVEAGEVKGYEHPNKGKDEASPSKKKRKPGAKYNRRDVTQKDIILLAFMEKFKFLTTKQAMILGGVARSTAAVRLNGLKEMGLIDQERSPMMPALWYLKAKGKVALDAALHFDDRAGKIHSSGSVSPGLISHTLFEGQVAAQITAGLEPLGRIGVMTNMSPVERLQVLADETYLRKAWGKATFDQALGSKGQAQRGETIARNALTAAERSGEWSEMIASNPSMWTITVPTAYRTKEVKEFHYPDLVVDMERFRTDAEPVSFAVELELTPKSSAELKKVLNTFKVARDKSVVKVYRKVIYLVPDMKMGNTVQKAVSDLGLEGYVMVRPIADVSGKGFAGKAWDL